MNGCTQECPETNQTRRIVPEGRLAELTPIRQPWHSDVIVEMIDGHMVFRAGCQAVIAHDLIELKTRVITILDDMFRDWFAKKT